MKKITTLLILLSLTIFNSCDDNEEKNTVNFIAFQYENFEFGVNIDGESTREIEVYATTTSSSDRVLNVSIVEDESTMDLTAVTVPTSVTIPANSKIGTLSITIQDVDIDSGKSLVLKLEGQDEAYIGKDMLLNIVELCTSNEITLSVVFDGYASESSFTLTDSDDTVLSSLAAGTLTDGLETYTEEWCLAAGTYTFTFNDGYGDGLSYPADGTVTVTDADGTVLYSATGDFGSSYTDTFTLE